MTLQSVPSRSRLEFLLDPEFGSLRTFPKIGVPGYTRFQSFPLPSANAETDTPERFRALFVPDFLARFELEGGEMAVCNKRPPHSITDTMIIQADADVRSRFRDLSGAQQRFVLSASHRFVDFVSDTEVAERYGLRGGYVHVTYNTSAETCDRENGMGYTKRFHLHLNYWRASEFDNAKPSLLSELSAPLRNELVDPFTPLASDIVVHHMRRHGVFNGKVALSVGPGDVATLGLPPGVAIKLDSWDELRGVNFAAELQNLQQIVFDSFQEIQLAFTGQADPAPMWRRHSLLPPAEIRRNLKSLELPAEAEHLLSRLATVLRSITPRHGELFRRNKSLRTRNMLMNGANFSVGFVSLTPNLGPVPISQSNQVWLILQIKMLSTLGSAGIFCNGLAPVIRIARNAREISTEEDALRLAFQTEFSERLKAA